MVRAFWEDSLTLTTIWGNSQPAGTGRYNLPIYNISSQIIIFHQLRTAAEPPGRLSCPREL